MHDPLNTLELLRDEVDERREDGYDLRAVEQAIERAVADSRHADGEELLARLEATERLGGWRYVEPSTLPEILASLPSASGRVPVDFAADELGGRIHAAWLGRAAGCMLGKPFEFCTRASILRYLHLAGAYPLLDYVPVLDPMPAGISLNSSWPQTTRGRIREAVRDDDLDYTVLGLHILESHGFDFGPEQVAREWLEHLPFLQVYTAERAAMRNLISGLRVPETAYRRNPYRQWIGAQIRADMWGYVCPGDPAAAARLAFTDASLSHVQNGIYGAMWAAALIAAAFSTSEPRAALDTALSFVPPRSRLAEALRSVCDWHEAELSWDQVRDRLESTYGNLSPFHTINNAGVVAAALLFGDGDFSRTIGLAVEGGWDTDCNGATAGSVFGAMHGEAALPAHWTEPLSDRLRSALFGFDGSHISELAARTLALALGHRNGGASQAGGAAL